MPPRPHGKERLKSNGSKAHPTQKPEALLYRVILSSSNPGDVVLDPFFGSGSTGAVAKKLHRHWLGIEKEVDYVELARQRLDSVEPEPFLTEAFSFPSKRNRPRIPFGALVENGLLKPEQTLYFGKKGGDYGHRVGQRQIKTKWHGRLYSPGWEGPQTWAVQRLGALVLSRS